MSYPQWPAADVPAVTREQMTEVDRVMIEDLGVELLQMMENAGRHLAEVAISQFAPSSVVVLAGSGGNGGGGLAAARHLVTRGVRPTVVIGLPPADLGGAAGSQLAILTKMGVTLMDQPAPADLVLDAVIGYGLRGEPRGRRAELIRWANSQQHPVLALDNPSGLDVTSGQAKDPCISAQATLTLALPKTGLLAAPQAGELFLADISVPPGVYRRLGLMVPNDLFAASSIVHLVTE